MRRSYVWVQYASHGKQLAVYYGESRNGGSAKVRKYQANSRRWTGVLYMPPGLLLRPATPAEVSKHLGWADAKRMDEACAQRMRP